MLIHSRPPDKDERLFFILTQKAHQQISPCRSLRQFTSGFRVCAGALFAKQRRRNMEFFNSAVDVLKTLVVALGAGLGVWGAVNLMEGYGGDNPSAKSQGMKQLMAGGGVALIGITLIPLLSGLFG
jgi:hypothetical protein